jgi:hypothetical protein
MVAGCPSDAPTNEVQAFESTVMRYGGKERR